MNEIIEKIKRYFCFGKLKYIRFERSYLKNKNETTNRKFLLRSIVGSLILLIGVMLFPPVEFIFMYLTGVNTKLEFLKFIGWGMSGLIAIFGVIGLLQRATALDEQNKISEKGHVHERFKAATEHLGSEHISVRIAAFYEFYRLAKIEPEPDLRDTIFYILCAHLRKTTKDEYYQKNQIEPTEETQSLLNILFKPHIKYNFLPDSRIKSVLHVLVFDGMYADLEGVHLQGTNLIDAYLQGAQLQTANLHKAYLPKTDMQWANLRWARLQNADLQNANLYGAKLQYANLHEAHLQGTNLQNATINKITKMPDGWKNVVKQDNDGKTGVLLVDDEGNVIEHL